MGLHANMVKVTAASPGTGNITVSTAVSGFRTFAQGFNNADATVAGVRIQDASDATIWEIDENCSYTYSTNLLTRGTRKDSSTGSAVNFTGSVIVSVVETAGFGNAVDNTLGAWGALNGENSITGAATAVIGRLNVCSGTSANYTVTLPAVSGNSGKYIGFLMAAALTKLVTLDGNSTETIDGATTRVMWAGETALLYCDGSTWTKMAGKSIALLAEMKRNSAQSINVTEVTLIDFNAVEYDASGLFASTTNNRFDCPRNGKFSVVAGWYPATAMTVGGFTHARIHAGTVGSTTERKTSLMAVVTGSLYPMNIISTTLSLSAGEVIEFHVYHSESPSINTASSGEAVMARMTVMEVLSW